MKFPIQNNQGQDKTEKLKDEAKKAFWPVVIDGVVDSIASVRSTWYGEDAYLYHNERHDLERYLSPIKWGLATGLFVFVNFRVTGSQRFQRMRTQWLANNKKNNSNLPHQHQQQQQPEFTSHLERQRIEREKAAMKSIKPLTDFLVSISVGMSAILLLLDAEKKTMRQDFEEAPLVCGRSVVADSMCNPMVTTASKFLNQLPSDVIAKDINLNSFNKFSTNCQLRTEYEEKLRQERQMKHNEPVIIPWPGLTTYRSTRE